MADEITTRMGRAVGTWSGAKVQDLQTELDRIRKQMSQDTPEDRLFPAGIPHRNQLPEDLHKFSAYAIWACDQEQNCLCGARANRVVSVADVRQFSMIDHH